MNQLRQQTMASSHYDNENNLQNVMNEISTIHVREVTIDNIDTNQHGNANYKKNTLLEIIKPLPISSQIHLTKIRSLLTWSDRHGGKWIGIRKFLDIYFSTVFHMYFGSAFQMNIIHMAKKNKISCKFVLVGEKFYCLVVNLNYPLWDKLLNVGIALPDKYFETPLRTKINMSSTVITSIPFMENGDGNSAVSQNSEYLFSLGLGALGLIDLLEESMRADLAYYNLDHVVTLSKFFSGNPNSKKSFVTSVMYD